jgi:hypothetical protein
MFSHICFTIEKYRALGVVPNFTSSGIAQHRCPILHHLELVAKLGAKNIAKHKRWSLKLLFGDLFYITY